MIATLMMIALLRDREMSCEDAMVAAKYHAGTLGIEGNVSIVKCMPHRRNDSEPMDGWSVDFVQAPDRQFSMRLGLDGQLAQYDRRSSDPGWKHEVNPTWQAAAITRGSQLLKSIGNPWTVVPPSLPTRSPAEQKFAYSATLNNLPIVGSRVGYDLTFQGPKHTLMKMERWGDIPTPNAKVPTISTMDAVTLVEKTYPSDKDFEHDGARKVEFGKPVLAYYYRNEYGPKEANRPARLVWYMTSHHSHRTKYSVKGGTRGIAVDAVTGSILDDKLGVYRF